MSIAVLADIHGNFQAFQTCVQYALKRNVKGFIFLGDYLGEFAFPQKTMELIYQLRDSFDCTFIKGNKENYWLNYRDSGECGWKEYDSTTGSLYYTYHNLTDRDMEFFSSLEIAAEFKIEDMEAITICHGSPRNVSEALRPDEPNTYETIEKCDTRILLHGHTHIHKKIEHNGKIALNPGSVGAPLWNGGKTNFMILHQNGNQWEDEPISLQYDVEKEIQNLYAARLDQLAPYWCRMTESLLRTGKYPHFWILDRAMQYCREEQGECIWPNIPERFWKKAYDSYFKQPEEPCLV